MADEDKEKAEKLAAAKKRFEQLKKEQQKKGKKASGKKREDKAGPTDSKTEDAPAEAVSTEEADEVPAATHEENPTAEDDATGATDLPERPAHTRQASASVQSKQRSESFRQGSVPSPVATDGKAAAGAMSPQMEVRDLYRKQSARIEELEKENKMYKDQQEDGAARLAHTEEELESLREGSSNIAEIRIKAKEADRLSVELASLQRQLAQAHQAAKGNNRRASTAGPDVSQQLASKTSTIESLELELSKLRSQVTTLQSTISERDAAAQDAEERIKAAEASTDSYKQELDALKVSMTFPSEETQAANENPEALTKRITLLESDLRTANNNLDAAAQRATSLEQKIEALTKVHRDATSGLQTKDRELTDLRNQLKKRDRPSHVRDASEFDLGEEETEAGALNARIRALEAENFELRRGVWREKRAELQPGMEDEGAPEYEDVDLDGPHHPLSRNRGSIPRQTSSFQDVITSGITAFTGRPRDAVKDQLMNAAHARKQSLGLLSDDGGFDEDAFRQAQEEEGKRRIERVKEVKRGLENWRGWRLDIAELRRSGLGGGHDFGPVFEV